MILLAKLFLVSFSRHLKSQSLITWLSVAARASSLDAMSSDDEDERMRHLCDEFEELCRQLRYHQKEYVVCWRTRG